MRYDLGDGVSLRHSVIDADGAPVSATVVLTITDPSGNDTTPALDELSTGVYANVPVVADETGIWEWVWNVSGTVTDIISGTFSVTDPAPPAYASLAELKSFIGIRDTERDAVLNRALLAASRSIDRACGSPYRRFWVDRTATAQLIECAGNTFRRRDGRYALIVPDIAALSTVSVSGRTDVTADAPLDGAITRLYSGSPWPETTVEITARWGWPYIPDDIVTATLIFAARLFKRRDSPEGVAGNTEWGAIRVTRRDPDVMNLIEPLMLPGMA